MDVLNFKGDNDLDLSFDSKSSFSSGQFKQEKDKLSLIATNLQSIKNMLENKSPKSELYKCKGPHVNLLSKPQIRIPMRVDSFEIREDLSLYSTLESKLKTKSKIIKSKECDERELLLKIEYMEAERKELLKELDDKFKELEEALDIKQEVEVSLMKMTELNVALKGSLVESKNVHDKEIAELRTMLKEKEEAALLKVGILERRLKETESEKKGISDDLERLVRKTDVLNKIIGLNENIISILEEKLIENNLYDETTVDKTEGLLKELKLELIVNKIGGNCECFH